ncbi:MAG: acetylornithine deacetylase [Rhizobiaceae bacterium]
MPAIDILERLISFDTTSRNSNLELIEYVQNLFSEGGIESHIIHDETRTKANLYATIGPQNHSGVMLSGHTDVVPVDGQDWSHEPFRLTEKDGKLFGRGTADMKGFVAYAIAAMLKASKLSLKTPLHLALSYDEEIGCIGVHSMIEMLASAPVKPVFCIVGEPTNLTVATGHKGKVALRATCTGREGHSALAPLALNALHLGCDFVQEVRQMQAVLEETGSRDADYDISYTTLHVGKMSGGTVLNIVPNQCEIDFEIRNVAEDNPEEIIEEFKARASAIVKNYRNKASEAGIAIETRFSYPGLNTPANADVITFVKSLTGANGTCKVAFGTEGGLFSEKLDIPTVVCGPGSMSQGHKPDEFVSIDQLDQCEAMLGRLLERLESGI